MSATNYDLGEAFEHEFDAMMLLSACGGNTEKKALQNMTKPAFIMSGSSDCTCNPKTTSEPFMDILNSGPDACKFMGIIQDGIHCWFCDFDYDYLKEERQKECLMLMNPCGDQLEMHQQLDIVNEYMSMFMNAVRDSDGEQYANVSSTLQADYKAGVMSKISVNCTL